MRIFRVVLTGLTLVAGGCQDSDSPLALIHQPIIGGAVNTGDPAIMEVLSFRGNIGARCTATLVTPRILLLAAHCFVETPGFNQRFVFPGNDDRNVPDKDLIPIKTFVHDMQYTTPRQGHDFAIVVLDTPMTTRPVPINRAPLDQAQGRPVRYVGYGLNTVGNPATGGIKRQNTGSLAQVSRLLLSIGLNPHPACEGDSGGPLLFDDGKGESIVGVGSFVTNPACQRDSFYQRIDTQLAWLDEQIKKYDPGGMAPAPDAGAGDAAPASPIDAEPPAEPDAQAADALVPPMEPAPDAGSRDVARPPAMDAEPEPEPKPTAASGGGCSYAPGPGAGTSLILLLALGGVSRSRRACRARPSPVPGRCRGRTWP